MKRFLAFFLVFLVFSGCSTTADPCDDPQNTSCTRVLFIGNSYIYANDLPKMFAELAEAGQHKTVIASSAPGGWMLVEHAQSADTTALIQSQNWDFVVLQEQSQIPSVQPWRTRDMYPAARILVKQIRDTGANPLFFLTWAHRSGWPEYDMVDYESMQEQINTGYYGIAQELKVPVVPVGPAWLSAVKQEPDLPLWQEDGSHPTEEGTYLAACVFYAAIFQQSPVGLSYRAGLSEDMAGRLQSIASETVLNSQ